MFFIILRMNYLENKSIVLKKIGKRYFLPLSINDWIITIGITILFVVTIIKSNLFTSLFIIFTYIILLIGFLKSKLFLNVESDLGYEMNFKILYEIISKQKNISTSIETKGLFVFETYNNFEVENIVIFCDEKNFYINSFFQRRLFKKNSSSLFQLKELLNIKINEYKKQL